MSTDLDQKIYVAGHRGMVGSAIVCNLKFRGYTNIVTRTHAELELTNQKAVQDFFKQEKPNKSYATIATFFIKKGKRAIKSSFAK